MPELATSRERAYVAQRIAACPLFAKALPEDVAELARSARSVAVTRGKVIEPSRGRAEEIYIIENGAAALLQIGAGERQVLVALMGPGNVIGLVRAAENLAGHRAGQSTAWRALSNVTAIAAPLADFTRIMRRSPEITEACLSAIARSVREVTASFAAAIQLPLEPRLASFLERLGEIAAGNRWEPTANLGRVQQTQIAEMLAVSREHINRTLIMWEKSGLIFQSKSGDLIIQNRKRLAQLAGGRDPAPPPAADNEHIYEIGQHIDLGLNAAAFDLAMEGVKRSPKDERFKYYAALATAKMGAPDEALSLVESFKLTTGAANEDIASIGPRLRRDIAFSGGGAPDLVQLRAAAQGYEDVMNSHGGTYAGVNAAATYAMAGDLRRARAIANVVAERAAEALASFDDDETSYWLRATHAECALLSGDRDRAAAEFAAAALASDAAPGKIATTRRQLQRLVTPLGLDEQWIDSALPQSAVLFFSGPLSANDANCATAFSRLEREIDGFLENHPISAAIGALAAGSDILIAEKVLAAGAPFHAFLPLPPTQFLASSVEPSGGDWAARFIKCVEGAQTIDWARRVSPGRAAYRLGARIAMGRAIRLAQELAAKPIGFFAVQSDRTAENSISVENLEIWRRLGYAHELIADDWCGGALARDPSEVTYLAALILEDGGVAAGKQPKDNALFRLARGDLSIIAFEMPEGAFAATERVLGETRRKPARIWLDVGVGRRDGADAKDFFNTLITANCRPQTLANHVYASEPFAFAAVATCGRKPRFEYAGFAPVEEKLDPMPLYLARF